MTQWDDSDNRETRAYPRQAPPPAYPPAGGSAGDAYPGGGSYGQNGPYGAQYGDGQYDQYGRPLSPQAQAAERQRRARFEDSTKNPFGAASDQAFGIVCTVLALLGGILGIVTLTGLQWFSFSGNPRSFSDVHDAISANPGPVTGFASAYFGWLAWVFLVVGVLAGVMASFPSPALRVFRVLGVVIGFAAAGLSFLAIQIDQTGYVTFLKDARIGFYLMVIAYLMIGVGAAIGPRKV